MDVTMNIRKEGLSPADQLLITKTLEKIPERYPDSFTEDQRLRVEHELNTIIDMGFPDYFLIVQDFLDIGRKIGHMPDDRMNDLREHCREMSLQEMVDFINEDQSYPGMTVGPGRGSAAGSAVAYLLGITDIDPFEHGLLFERFLNPERVTMPDIDSDFSKSEYEYGVRDLALEYVTKKYGANAVCGINTPSTLAARAAVKSVARVIGSKHSLESSGGKKTKEAKAKEEQVKKQYLRFADEINAKVPEGPNVSFMAVREDGGTLLGDLRSSFAERPELIEIIEMAARAEGLNINYGMHACGKIIYPGDVRDAAALMYDKENAIWKIQMDAEQAESMGLLKMDFLGLKNLNIITKAVRLVYENLGVYIDCSHLPEDPEVYQKVFAEANTMCVFQFESPGMRKMLRQFGPERFSDLILLVACYRPGPMKYLDGIIQVKHNGPQAADPNSVLTRIPQIAEIIEPTYLAIVYQEQVQQVFRTLAGYSLGQADLVRRAMGHKKMDVLQAEREAFLYGDETRGIDGCAKRGVNTDDAARLFEDMLDFAKYAFNKSHAAAYAQVAYITGWLKFHYPTEFYTAALSFTDISKYPAIIQEAKAFGVSVLGPDIEYSKSGFTGKDGKIYFGFSGIKGLGESVKGEIGLCPSIADFMLTSKLSDSTITRLVEVGAFDRKSPRQALLAVLPDYLDERKVIKDKEKEIRRVQGMIADLDAGLELDREKWKITTKSIPTREKLEKKIETLNGKVSDAATSIRGIIIPAEAVPENVEKNLEMEKDYLGMYASGHPLDPFGTPEDYGAVPVSELVPNRRQKIFGIVSGYRQVFTKVNPKPMCLCKLEDTSGSINVCFFPKAYDMTGACRLKNGDVVAVTGDARPDERSGEETLQFYPTAMPEGLTILTKKKQVCLVEMEGVEDWERVRTAIMNHLADGPGYPVRILNLTTGEIENTAFLVDAGVWSDRELAAREY